MHIKCDEVPVLADLFKKKYERDLIGKSMGQFHVDFSSGKIENIIRNENFNLVVDNLYDTPLEKDIDSVYDLLEGIEEEKHEGYTNECMHKVINKARPQLKDLGIDVVKSDIYASDSIIISKKVYYDELSSKGITTKDEHFRLKGIPNISIKHYCRKNDLTVKKLYEKMFDGEAVTFDLTCENTKPKFNIKDFTCDTKLTFDRTIKF